ncbi:MAG TPA: hypothetical protein VF481_01380 [Novosphingobium sp.]
MVRSRKDESPGGLDRCGPQGDLSCSHWATFDPHGLWWRFEQKHWDMQLGLDGKPPARF